MFWKIVREEGADGRAEAPGRWDGRFVLHRHCDAEGAHLDLRLEQEGYLLGWRIDGVALEETLWATEKAPHPLCWLDQDGEAVREDAGAYAWLERDGAGGVLLLQGRSGEPIRCRVARHAGLPARVVRDVVDALAESGVRNTEAARAVRDGLTARRRAVERLCGLGRELDGAAFDEAVWRKALEGLSLEEIHGQLRAFEVRFDAKYPPQPVSRPERLPDDEADARGDEALAIAREA